MAALSSLQIKVRWWCPNCLWHSHWGAEKKDWCILHAECLEVPFNCIFRGLPHSCLCNLVWCLRLWKVAWRCGHALSLQSNRSTRPFSAEMWAGNFPFLLLFSWSVGFSYAPLLCSREAFFFPLNNCKICHYRIEYCFIRWFLHLPTYLWFSFFTLFSSMLVLTAHFMLSVKDASYFLFHHSSYCSVHSEVLHSGQFPLESCLVIFPLW